VSVPSVSVPSVSVPSVPVTPDPDLIAELAGLLLEVTGEDGAWAAAVTAQSRLELDLKLDSVEVAALAVALREAYGDAADLERLLVSLEIDELLALTVGDLARYVAGAAERGAGAA